MKKYFFLYVVLILFVFGCSQEQDYARLAKRQAGNAQVLYESSIQNYLKAISQKDLPKLHFELGKVYYEHGQYEDAIAQLKNLDPKISGKILAISYFKHGDYTSALNIFEKNLKEPDSEALYYFGLTCEKLNLFEKAVEIYTKIEDKKIKVQAIRRIEAINLGEKSAKLESPFLKELIESGGRKESYPEAGAVILLADETAEILPENKVIFYKHFIIKILNDRGKKDFAEININYDSTYEKVELEMARTIKPDGSIIEVGDKNIRDVSRYLNFPLYSNARIRIVSMPEIVEGAVIEYKAKIIQNQMIAQKEFNLGYLLQDTNPIKTAKFGIITPQDKQLFIKTINQQYNKNNLKLIPEITEKKDKVIYSWEFKDIPQIIPEANSPPVSEITPIILISSFDSWDKIYSWWKELSLPKIKSTPQIEEQTNELIKDKKTDLEKLESIFNYCAANIRYVAVEYGQAGYEPHEAGDVFKNKYGDCKDQAVLLCTMLNNANIEAYPVLISTREKVNLQKDFPSGIFNHAIAVAIVGAKPYFLDATAETSSITALPFDDQNRNVLVFKKDNFEIMQTPVSGADENFIQYNLEIEIDKEEKVKGRREVIAQGQFGLFQRYWLKYSQPEIIKQMLNKRVQEISTGTRLLDYKVENLATSDRPIKLTYFFEGGTIFISSGDLKILPELATIVLSQAAKERRIYPLDLGFLNTVEINIKFKLDPAYTCKYLPPSLKRESKWLSFENSYTKNNNEIIFYQKQKINVQKINIDEYESYKKFVENLKDETNQRIILEKNKR